jgi:hypothetical protein
MQNENINGILPLYSVSPEQQMMHGRNNLQIRINDIPDSDAIPVHGIYGNAQK